MKKTGVGMNYKNGRLARMSVGGAKWTNSIVGKPGPSSMGMGIGKKFAWSKKR
jgi:hypothetical protein